jgi:hypothetical protein
MTDFRHASGAAMPKRRIAVIVAIPGLLATAAFAILWFGNAAGGCGVVRFYDYLLDGFFLALWAGGTGIGLLMFLSGGNRNRLLAVSGMGLVLLSAFAMLALLADTALDVRAAAEVRQENASSSTAGGGRIVHRRNAEKRHTDTGGNEHE